MIRLGLVGCGRWGRNYVRAAEEAGNCRVVCVAGGAAFAPDVDRYDTQDWRSMADAPVDAFVIATPPRTHQEIATEILSWGRPVLVEKPMALDVVAATRMAIASALARAPLAVAHQHLFAPAYERLRDITGSWSHVDAIAMGGGDGPVRDYSALWDYGPHDVAMTLGLTDGRCFPKVHGGGGGRRFRALLEGGRCSASVHVWNDGSRKVRLLAATNGERVLAYNDQDEAKLRRDGEPVSISDERPLTRMLRAFAEVVGGAAADWRLDPMLGVEVVRVLETAEAGAARAVS